MTKINDYREPKLSSEKKPLSDFFGYICNFHHLDMNLKTNSARQKYHDDWMRKYDNSIKKWDDYETSIWAIRLRQSLKLCFSAAYFSLESRKAKKEKMMASAYYLGYYSALHAMWAVIYLDPQQTTKNAYEITHSKMLNLFHSTYAQGTGSILDINTKSFVENLRFLREYYSYRMPLNSPIDSDHELQKSLTSLVGFVKQCVQVANLQSHLIMKSAEKNNKYSARVPIEKRQEFSDVFFSINGKERTATKEKILDPADNFAFHEAVNVGCDIMAHSISFEHMFDNFMTYRNEQNPDGDIISQTRQLVGSAL